MSFDWQSALKGVAPILATAAGGPLAGGVVKILTDQILGSEASGDPVQDEATLAGILAGGVTPELRAKIIEGEALFRSEALKAGVREREIDAEVEKAYLLDVADARKSGNSADLMILGSVILTAWAVLTAGTLWALFSLATGGIRITDAGLAATVFTLVGSLTGYITNAAQQVLSYFYGSSRGSAIKTDALTASVSAAGRR